MKTQQQSLEIWRDSLVASVRGDAPDLSARQMALLLCVYLSEGPHTVRGLAQHLKISKPAVSRALDRLGELSYIRRERDDLDRRNVLIQRTPEGGQFLIAFAEMIQEAEKKVGALPADRPLAFALEALTATAAALAADGPATQDWADAAA